MTSKLTPEQQKEVIDKVARLVVKFQMTAPALLFLITFKPLAWMGGRYATIFLEPFLPFYEVEAHELIEALGEIENVDVLIERIEELEEEKKEQVKSGTARTDWMSRLHKRVRAFIGKSFGGKQRR